MNVHTMAVYSPSFRPGSGALLLLCLLQGLVACKGQETPTPLGYDPVARSAQPTWLASALADRFRQPTPSGIQSVYDMIGHLLGRNLTQVPWPYLRDVAITGHWTDSQGDHSHWISSRLPKMLQWVEAKCRSINDRSDGSPSEEEFASSTTSARDSIR